MRQHIELRRISAAPGEASRRTRRAFSGLLRSIRADEDGQGVLEFALVLPLLAALVLIFVQFGKAVYFDINLTHLANEGARLAVVNPGAMPDGSASLATFLCNGLSTAGGEADHATVVVSYPSNASNSPATSKTVGDAITVVVKSNYHLFPFQGAIFPLVPLSGTATMRLEQNATSTAIAAGTTTCP